MYWTILSMEKISFPQLRTCFLGTKACLFTIFGRVLNWLIDDSVEEAHMIFFTSVSAAFWTFLAPFLRHNNPENIIDQIHLDLSVNLRSGR